MKKSTITKWSRLNGYSGNQIDPDVKKLQSAINSLSQLDRPLARALNAACEHMVQNSGRSDDYDFYNEDMFSLYEKGDDYFKRYYNLVEGWYEYKRAAEAGEFIPLEPYEKIISRIEEIATLDL